MACSSWAHVYMQLSRLTGLVLVGAALLALGVGDPPRASRSLEPDTELWVAPTKTPVGPPVDTLRPSVEAGEPLILDLPAELDASPVSQYSLIQGPSLSGVAGHSFTWVTHSVEPDTYEVTLQANRPDASPDTLWLHVEVHE